MANTKLDHITLILLALILILAVGLTYYPHLHYQFPLHVDEYYHIATAQGIAEAGPLAHLSLYTGQNNTTDLEVGYHTFLAVIYLIFNPSIIDWIYLPSILQVIAVLSVFLFVYKLLGRDEALIAALLIALLPTNVTIGGPVFLIPENLGLIFIPIALLFAFRLTKIKPIYNYIGVFAVLVFLLYSHPPTALVLLVILFVYVALLRFSKPLAIGDKSNIKHSEYLLLFVLFACVAAVPNYIAYVQLKGVNSATFNLPILTSALPFVYGIVQTLFFVVGFYLVARKGNKELWSILAAALILFAVIFLFVNFKINYGIPYQRAYIPLFLLMSIIASIGYASLLKLNKGAKGKLGLILLIVALVATMYLSIHNDIRTPYYHLINDQDYQNFLYIKNHFNESSIAILNPYTARAFTPITGLRVYSVEPFGPSNSYSVLLNNTNNFFDNECNDTAFLRSNNISIVYTNITCSNSNLTLVNNETYVLDK